MKLAMLARNAGLYSHKRIVEAARARGHEIEIFDSRPFRLRPWDQDIRFTLGHQGGQEEKWLGDDSGDDSDNDGWQGQRDAFDNDEQQGQESCFDSDKYRDEIKFDNSIKPSTKVMLL